jgi:alpha-tubulin suppressor-like RCC1 family protein
VSVSGISDASSLASDTAGFCAALATGHVDCWGFNGNGDLGEGSDAQSAVPVSAVGIISASQVISNGQGGYCAWLSTGSIECWGYNADGQLGNGTNNESNIPTPVSNVSDATEVTSDGNTHGYNTGYCALLVGGYVDCWGSGLDGQLGNSANMDSNIPVQVDAP